MDHEDLPDNSMANAESWAAGIPGPAYAIDDQTAIKVTDGTIQVVSEGTGNCSPTRTDSHADRDTGALGRSSVRATVQKRRHARGAIDQ